MTTSRLALLAALGLCALCAQPAAAGSVKGTIFTLAGIGKKGAPTPGGVAGGEPISPRKVASTPDGGAYILLRRGSRIVRLRADGRVFPFAGTGKSGDTGDGGPALDARIQTGRIASTINGSLLMTSSTGGIRQVFLNGAIDTVAGLRPGEAPPASSTPEGEDGRLATEVALSGYPAGYPGGGFLVSDGRGRVRHVRADGRVFVLAGGGERWYPRTRPTAWREAVIDDPGPIAAFRDGGFVLVEESTARGTNDVILRATADGLIRQVAGGEELARDGLRARRLLVSNPDNLVALPGGGFLIAESLGVWRVGADNRVRVIAGRPRLVARNEDLETSGDGGPARGATGYFNGAARLADGGLALVDLNNRLRYVAPRRPGLLALALRHVEPAGRRLAVPFVTTLRSNLTLRLLRGTKVLTTKRFCAPAGQGSVEVKAPQRAGRYRIELTGRTLSGKQAATARNYRHTGR